MSDGITKNIKQAIIKEARQKKNNQYKNMIHIQ
jgi:hypothetical protein